MCLKLTMKTPEHVISVVLVFFVKFEHSLHLFLVFSTALPAFTCSKLTTETLEKGVKYVQS